MKAPVSCTYSFVMSSSLGNPCGHSESSLSFSSEPGNDTTIPDPYDPNTDNPFETPLPNIEEPGHRVWGRERPVKDPGPEQDPRPAPRRGGGATQASDASATQRGGCPLCKRWRCSCLIRGDRNDPSSGMGVPPQGSVAASESSGTSSPSNSMSASSIATSISSFYSNQEALPAATTGQSSQPRQNVYFVPRDGIDREVITADICRYLGKDALVRPGTNQDPQTSQIIQGYQISAYRNLTSAMIQDLKMDSYRWESEKRKGRYDGYGGAQGPAQYPGSNAPGYSGSGSSAAYESQGYNAQTTGYNNSPYYHHHRVHDYTHQAVASSGYAQGQAGYHSAFSQQNIPFVQVDANYPSSSVELSSSSGRFYTSGNPYFQGQDSTNGYNYSQAQMQSAYAPPVDPFLSHGNNQTDYNTSTPTTDQHVSYKQQSQGERTASSTSRPAQRSSDRASDAQKLRRRKGL